MTFLLRKKAYFPNQEPKVSRIDFSKLVSPDHWIVYKENKKNIPLLAIPKFVDEYESCWEINLAASFFKEDLRYGVKPITIYNHLATTGLGPIIWGKHSNKAYELGSGHWFYHDVIKEYNKFVNNEKSKIKWELLEIKIE